MSTAQVGWSPSQDQHIAGTRQAADMARETLFSVAERELNKVPGNDEAKARLYGRLHAIKLEIDKFVAEASKARIAELEIELEQLCAEGEKAEQAFVEASNNELAVRRADAERQNRYGAASRALANLKNAQLGAFHTNRDVKRKLEHIANAQDEVDAAIADMQEHPNAIPVAIKAKKDAHLRVDEFVGKVRALRAELDGLKGEAVASTGGHSGDSATGLGGLR